MFCPRLFLHGCRDFVALSRILGVFALLAMAAFSPRPSYAQLPLLPPGPSQSNKSNPPSKSNPPAKTSSPTKTHLQAKPERTSDPTLATPVLDVGQSVSITMATADVVAPSRMPGISGDAMSVGTVMARWDFGRSEDTDYDGWPEGWQRKRDRDHPPYLPMKLVANDPSMMQAAQAADLRVMQAWPFAIGPARKSPLSH
jgi:hypothetical protein